MGKQLTFEWGANNPPFITDYELIIWTDYMKENTWSEISKEEAEKIKEKTKYTIQQKLPHTLYELTEYSTKGEETKTTFYI